MSFYKISVKRIYYDIKRNFRNLEFCFNLGQNNIANEIKSNVGLVELVKNYFNRKLTNSIKKTYKNLLIAISEGNIQYLNKHLESKLKNLLIYDLSNITKKGYNIELLNQDSEIFVRYINIFKLHNVNVKRDKNDSLEDYEILQIGKNSVIFQKIDKNQRLKEFKSENKLAKEEELFMKSNYRETALNHLKENLVNEYNIEYSKKNLKSNSNEDEIEKFGGLISSLQMAERDPNDPFSKQIKEDFKDYFENKRKFIENGLKNTNLFNYFRQNLPSQYKDLTQNQMKEPFFVSISKFFRKKWVDITYSSALMSSKKILYVIDVEISTKMRLNIKNQKEENILNSEAFSEEINTVNDSLADEEEYDPAYKLNNSNKSSLQKQTSDPNSKEFIQKHLIRFEFEKTAKFHNIFKNYLKDIQITDIDLAMKGNRHFIKTKI